MYIPILPPLRGRSHSISPLQEGSRTGDGRVSKLRGVGCGQSHRARLRLGAACADVGAAGRPASYHNESAGLGHTSREEQRMTKADLVEQVADVIGPRVHRGG